MKHRTVAFAVSSVAMALALITSGSAMAGDPVQCREQAEVDCALFFPRGTFQWAYCVENLTEVCVIYQASQTRPFDEIQRESCALI